MELYLGHSISGVKIMSHSILNSHLYTSGQSGQGKSFLLKAFILQAVNQGAHVTVLDYTGDFLNYTPPKGLRFRHIDVASPSFSINPLLGRPDQSPDVRAQQLLATLHSVFRMGRRATAALRQATMAYVSATASPTLNGLLAFIDETENKGRGLEAAQEPLALLASLVHSGNQPISLDLGTSGLTVVDFTKIIDRDLCKLLVELVLQTLWATHTPELPPLILVLDECQNLNWGANSMSIRILREGRKFGISGWFSSQWIADKNAAAALGQAAFQAHFRPDSQHIDKLARSLCSGRSSDLPQYRKLIQGLRRGQFLWQRPDGKPVIITVSP